MCSTVKKRWEIYHIIAIEKYSGARNGKIRADFYDDCQNIPDPSALDPAQNNLLLLDDCFQGKQNKVEAYYTRGRHNNCDTIYICSKLYPVTSTNNSRKFKLFFYPFPTRREESHKYPCANDISLLEFKQFCHGVWSKEHNFVTIDLTRTPTIDSISQLVLYKATWKHTDQSWDRLEIGL